MPTTDELAAWLIDKGVEKYPDDGRPSAEELAEALMVEFDIQGSANLSIFPHQHCTYENRDGVDDYSFSHTAAYCGKPQPRRCGCAFCY